MAVKFQNEYDLESNWEDILGDTYNDNCIFEKKRKKLLFFFFLLIRLSFAFSFKAPPLQQSIYCYFVFQIRVLV
jgi:hypothetical protein